MKNIFFTETHQSLRSSESLLLLTILTYLNLQSGFEVLLAMKKTEQNNQDVSHQKPHVKPLFKHLRLPVPCTGLI